MIAARPAERPAPTGGRILPSIDALRGVAVIAVFLQHLGDRYRAGLVEPALAGSPWLLTIAHHAWWGVDLFFVLSGFTLALGYLERPAPAAVFWRRRVARIVPGFWVALLVVVLARPAVALASDFDRSLLAHALLLQGYVGFGGIVLIGAAWSLTTEAHFYLLMPLLAPRLLTGPVARRLGWTVLLCAGAWTTRAILHAAFLRDGVHTPLLEASQRHWITSRLDQFVLGAAAASIHRALSRSTERRRIARAAPAAVALSLAGIVAAFRLEGELYLQAGGSWPYALLSIGTALLVLSAANLEGTPLRLAAPRALQAVGVVSYGVFLYHQLVLSETDRLLPGGAPSWSSLAAQGAFAFALSLAAGYASWRLVELRAIRWAQRAAPPRATAACYGALPNEGIKPSR